MTPIFFTQNTVLKILFFEIPRTQYQDCSLDSVASGSTRAFRTSEMSLRIPQFWKENPPAYFVQLEAQFQNHRKVSKYLAILPELGSDVLSQVSEGVIQQPIDAYQKIRNQLIKPF